jgi:hypothetical protein
MQTEILDLIIEFIISPFFLFVVVMLIVLGVARSLTGRKSQSGVPVVRQMRRMASELEKDKDLSDPVVQSRRDIITQKFNSQMQEIGLEPSADSGYVPASHTPLARFLKDRGVHEDTVGAILAGIMEEENEAEVRAIIDAAADTPDVDLTGEELAKAQDLAVTEWTNAKRSREA